MKSLLQKLTPKTSKKTLLFLFLSTLLLSTKISQKMSTKNQKSKITNIDLSNKQAIIIGGTSGIGMGMAQVFASLNANVIIVGRNEIQGEKIVKEMERINWSLRGSNQRVEGGRDDGSGVYRFVEADVVLLSSVKGLVSALGVEKVDYLVCTQGIASMEGRVETEEGIDRKMALHYYSRIGIANEMVPLLERSNDPRVMFVLSGGVHGVYGEYERDPDLMDYSLWKAANAAGMYLDIGVDSLHREYPMISFYHAAPGFVATNWGAELPSVLTGVTRALQALFAKSPEDCGYYLIKPLILDDKPEEGWAIINEYGVQIDSKLKEHDEARDFIWNHTLQILSKNNIHLRN